MSSKFQMAADENIGGSQRQFKLTHLNPESNVIKINTNFEITRKEIEIISKTEGIDSFEQNSRYTVETTVGEMFSITRVITNLEKTMTRLVDLKLDQRVI